MVQRLSWCMNMFSISALVRTWFSPFKQTVSKPRQASIDGKIQAAIDNLVSRVVGSIARTFIIVAGLICMFLALITGLVAVIVWPIIPLLPLILIIGAFL